MLLVSVLSLLLIVSQCVEHEKRMLGSQKTTKREISKESARCRYYCALLEMVARAEVLVVKLAENEIESQVLLSSRKGFQ